MTDIAIRIENISRDFETVRAVDSLSLEVPSGIIFGFLGPNGVVPDFEVALDREQLPKGIDGQLEAAIEYAEEQIGK